VLLHGWHIDEGNVKVSDFELRATERTSLMRERTASPA
jgi:hypothetical protein